MPARNHPELAAIPLILIVDDNGPKRYALGRTLQQHGFDVIEAGTGEDALKRCSAEHPDLVLLDVNLPDLHGFDVARRLKSGDITRDIPILQLSASFVQPEHRLEGLAAGADGYLVEPVEPGELVASIRALLRLRDAEEGLRRTTAMLAAVVEASPLAIVVFGDDLVIRTWNRAAEQMFGWSRVEIVGADPAMGRPAFLTDDSFLDRLRRANTATGMERRYLRKDGTFVDVQVFVAPLETATTAGFLAIFEDISARKRYELERTEILAREREARQEAEAANRLKDDFLATLSHELRTPLNAIMGWASMLRRPTLTAPERERAWEVIDRNLRSQQQLISDILEVSQIIRGQLRLDMHPVNVADAVAAAIESVAPTAAAKHQSLNWSEPDETIIVAGDSARLQQVFWNLLSNAVKYTPREGRIDVAITATQHDVDVRVTDTGVGIRPDVLPHIFERFRQGESGPTREYGGLGLGLAIVRHLAEMHGGSVRADSGGTGKGASFVVTLPRT